MMPKFLEVGTYKTDHWSDFKQKLRMGVPMRGEI